MLAPDRLKNLSIAFHAGSWLMAAAPPAAGETAQRLRLGAPALIIAGALLIAAAYLLIRMLEWDLLNRDTADQEDPLLK